VGSITSTGPLGTVIVRGKPYRPSNSRKAKAK
jgi:hypothetical protein